MTLMTLTLITLTLILMTLVTLVTLTLMTLTLPGPDVGPLSPSGPGGECSLPPYACL